MTMDQREGGDISYTDFIEKQPLESPIKNFYEGATVFITGATGFMGKILIEKILRTCPNVKKIYILAREKKGKDVKKRFEEQFSDPLYERLRKVNPDFMSKLAFVIGDVGHLRLGLNDKDYEAVCCEVNVVFHMAATVRFDERLQAAVRVNVRGTREALDLARNAANLRAFLHVSTAFSNCILSEIKERFYESPIAADSLINLVELVDEETLHRITPTLLGEFPNTYAYTKVAAENVIKDMSKDLPVAMIRPSIIIATAKEPVQGWIDNVYGPTGVVVGAGLGLLHTLRCDPDIYADIIPVDYVINACLVAAYEIARVHDTPNKEKLISCEMKKENDREATESVIPIYNYVSSNKRPISWKEFMKYNERFGLEIPSMLSMWVYSFSLNKNYFLHTMSVLLFHLIPAYLFDGIMYCIGKKPRLVKAYEKIHKFSQVITYFCTQRWHFETDNVEKLCKSLSSGDRELFDCDIANLNWEDYFYTHIRGLRVYLMKDPLDSVEKAKKRYKLLQLAHYSLLTVLLFGLLNVFWILLKNIF